MGLLDDVLASLAGAGAPASRSQSSALVEAMLEVLGNGAQTGGIGGLDGLSRVLQQQGGNVAAAARQLGISRNSIYRKRSPPA